MIFVHRNPNVEPFVREALEKKIRGKGVTELEDARNHYSSDPPPTVAYGFDRYSCEEVCEELDRIYKQKCAYCESKYAAVSVRNIEHYRPKGGVTEAPHHPGYWWLAAEWSNLLPSCPACNQIRHHTLFDPQMSLEQIDLLKYKKGEHRAGKGNSFPLNVGSTYALKEADSLTQEDPLLINPSVRDPSQHLEWVFRWEVGGAIWDAEWVLPFLRPRRVNGNDDPYGKASIAIYALNRLSLVLERMERVKVLQTALLPVIRAMDDLAKTPIEYEGREEKRSNVRLYWENLQKFRHEDQPYLGMTEAFLNEVGPQLRRFREVQYM
ncbi:hypothetical protein [Burkholderia lata]|uniref:hypothetical protein n=1 Tax=Burkholderia lata (strain ATCC 17760 / DSM 23089 / LMG 22485 / NCIMB 9086 / R18194 / 383) TaxID=482957 RepID=UPI0012EA1045|nr:hypothetical protein [Burkholderia lata]